MKEEESKEMEKVIDVTDVNKISSIIKKIYPNTVIKINVNLYQYNSKGVKKSYYSSLMYTHPKFGGNNINVTLELDTYLTIEQTKVNPDGTKAFVKLRESDIYWLTEGIYTMYKELCDNYDDYFKQVDDSYIISKKMMPIEIPTKFGGNIILDQCLLPIDGGPEYKGGIRICLGEVNHSVIVDLNEALEIYLILKELNLNLCGQMLANFIGRPNIDSNMYDMTNNEKYVTKTNYNNTFHM